MSRSCSHESQNACPNRTRAGRWPNGDSPVASQSVGANVATRCANASVPLVNWSSSSAFGTSRNVATCASVPLDGSKCSRNRVGGCSDARRAEREHPVGVDRHHVADNTVSVPLGAARRRLPLRVGQRAQSVTEAATVTQPRLDSADLVGDRGAHRLVVLAEQPRGHSEPHWVGERERAHRTLRRRGHRDSTRDRTRQEWWP